MDELLEQVAEIRGMPVSLVERSAQARAEKTGTTVEAVLREWLGEAGGAEEPATEAPEPASQEAAASPTPVETTPDVPPQPPSEITTDYLVQLAAEAKRMPPKLILTSAEARAKHSGISLDAVLADWAAVDIEELEAKAATSKVPVVASHTEPASPSPPEPEEPEPAPEPVSAAAPGLTSAVAAVSVDELLEKVTEVKGMPAPLAKRSAEARAKKTGESVDAILAEWAGIDPASVSTGAPVTSSEPAPPAETATPDTDSKQATADSADDVEIIEAITPDTSDIEEVDEEVSTVRSGYPMWLAAAFLLIPILAVAYILVSPNGPDCGSGGQLLVDPTTGEAVNCDGSPYGEATVDNFAAGGALYAQCAACHGADGSGAVGPAFTGGAVLETFPPGACVDHAEWVSVGTAAWPDPTYGANEKPVGGVGLMPGFGTSLSEEQVAQVALFERVAFGGQSLEEAEVDCGLVEAAPEG